MIDVKLLDYPTDDDWLKVKQRALVTVGLEAKTPPTEEWKEKILTARHSPIRRLNFGFYIECPYWVSVHLVRHIHAQPYVRSQRNDRQREYDRNAARQDEMISMIWDMNAEELITIANKRLCNQASFETQQVVFKMCREVLAVCPEFKNQLVPMCVREHGCHEMYPCKQAHIVV